MKLYGQLKIFLDFQAKKFYIENSLTLNANLYLLSKTKVLTIAPLDNYLYDDYPEVVLIIYYNKDGHICEIVVCDGVYINYNQSSISCLVVESLTIEYIEKNMFVPIIKRTYKQVQDEVNIVTVLKSWIDIMEFAYSNSRYIKKIETLNHLLKNIENEYLVDSCFKSKN